MRKNRIFLIISLVCLGLAHTAIAAFNSETYISGQSFITTIAFSPNGRMYFMEKNTGAIRVVIGQDSVRPEPFFTFNVNNLGERGGLGLTFHPNYPDSPYVYCYVTITGPVLANAVVRLVDSLGYGTHPDTILRAPITVQATNHNGGFLRFGPDGKLYITMGENAQAMWAQDTCRMQGKILRINYDGSIPGDNPIHCAPIYSYGNRSSIGICFHPVTGALYESENGPTENDEINLILPGRNYGWPIVECRSDSPAYQNALICWTPTIAPTGIIVAWNSRIPEFNGKLLMNDFNNGTLHLLALNTSGDSILTDDHIFNAGTGLVDIEQGPDGFFYLAGGGTIYRLRPTHSGPEPFPIYSPPHNMILLNDSLEFVWGNTIDTDSGSSFHFVFQFSPDSVFNYPVIPIDAAHDTSILVPTNIFDTYGSKLFWRVLAVANDSMITIGGIPFPEVRIIFIGRIGDANGNGTLNGLDVIYLVNYLIGRGRPPDPLRLADVNADCNANALDVVYLVNYFKGGPVPMRGNCP